MLLEDWIFARDYIRNGNDVLAGRLQRVAADIAHAPLPEAADEILVVGHSLGAVLAIDLIDRAMNIETEPSRGARKITFLSVGASILKIGLHRAAREFRAAIGRISSNPDVFWADYRARSDVMNFFGAELLRYLKLPPTGSPLVRNVSIRRMIAPERYPRIRKNWYKMHCQFVRGNDRQAPYDYFMMTCGPVSAEKIARSERGAMDMFDADGQLIESAGFSRELNAIGTAKP
jgi:pimeloyl-ACP methyl ester carboxylesterase